MRTRARVGAALAVGLGLALPVTAIATAASAAPAPRPFTIAGAPSGALSPGTSSPVDLMLTNPNDVDLTLRDLTIELTAVVPAVGATGPCTTADFEVVQLTPTEVVMPAHTARSMTALGVAPADLPQVSMLETAQNQNGCQNAKVMLAYVANATEGAVGGVTVPGTGTSNPGSSNPGSPAVDGAHLPRTGSDSTNELIAFGASLTILGGAAVVAARRRRSGR